MGTGGYGFGLREYIPRLLLVLSNLGDVCPKVYLGFTLPGDTGAVPIRSEYNKV